MARYTPHTITTSVVKDALMQTIASSSMAAPGESKRLKAAVGAVRFMVTHRIDGDVFPVYEGDDIKKAVKHYNDLG